MSYLFPYIEILKQPLKGKGLIRALYLKSDKIITRLFCCFLVVYIAFSIEYKSIIQLSVIAFNRIISWILNNHESGEIYFRRD